MSKLTFHSTRGQAQISGPEFNWMRTIIVNNRCLGLLNLDNDYENSHPLHRVIQGNNNIRYHKGESWKNEVRNLFYSGGEHYEKIVLTNGRSDGIYEVALNTAIVDGNDAVKLSARLCGLAEINTYVEGENRAWLASIIRNGRTNGIFRANMGWESVIELLETDDQSPIVNSISFTETGWEKCDWNESIKQLRIRNETQKLEINPENFNRFRFGQGVTVYDILSE